MCGCGKKKTEAVTSAQVQQALSSNDAYDRMVAENLAQRTADAEKASASSGS